MKQHRTLRVINVRPDHPARTRQHNNQGERYRDEGAVSEVHMLIDLGLKSGETGMIAMSIEEAINLVGVIAIAVKQATDVNRREQSRV